MMESLILAIDQGTTNSKAFLFSTSGELCAQASRPMTLSFPQPGWVEVEPAKLWQTVRQTIDEVYLSRGSAIIAAIAITNQRESVMLWDSITSDPIGPCAIWQCQRAADMCGQLRTDGAEAVIAEKTGLAIDPICSASKLAWLIKHIPAAAVAAKLGRLRAGTVDSWLLWKLTDGQAHATDASNGSRTQLMNIDSLEWDLELANYFDVPLEILPTIKPSNSLFGVTAEGVTALPAGISIHAIMGDSHAALYGHEIRMPGQVKVTLGTGSSLMALVPNRVHSSHGLSSTIAWWNDKDATHALEGNIFVSGQTAAFATKMLNLTDEEALTAMAQTVSDTAGVSFVPALAGLGAPHWKDSARGLICGMSLTTQPAHIARAALQAIALQIRDVFEAMQADIGVELPMIKVDGGAARSDVLMQLLSDLIGCQVVRPAMTEITAKGAARMAAEALGIWHEPVSAQAATYFNPTMDSGVRTDILTQWDLALARAKL